MGKNKLYSFTNHYIMSESFRSKEQKVNFTFIMQKNTYFKLNFKNKANLMFNLFLRYVLSIYKFSMLY